MIEILELSEAFEASYEEFIRNRSDSNIYHTLEWKNLIEKVYSFDSHYLLAFEGHKLVGVLPLFYANTLVKGRRYTSIPFSHHVPLLADSEVARHKLLSSLFGLMEAYRVPQSELRNIFQTDNSRVKLYSQNFLTSIELKLTKGELWNNLNKSSIQRSIKKAVKSDLEIDSSNTLEAYRSFYELQAITRKKQGAPMYSYSLFENLANLCAPMGYSKCYLARCGKKPVAGLIVLSFGTTAIYGYGGSLDDPDYLAMRPNHLLMWNAMLDAKNSNYATFDMGSTPENHDTLLRYKKGWGGATERLYYSYVFSGKRSQVLSRDSKSLHVVSQLIKYAPVALNKFIGPYLLRQIG